LWIDGTLTIDNWTKQRPGDFFYGQGTVEEKAVVDLEAGKAVNVLVEYMNTPPPDDSEDNSKRTSAQPALMRGVRLGGCEKIDPHEAINAAITLAKQCDVVVFVGGLTPEWESEGFDRPTLVLPGRQDELIAKLAAAAPTVVCIQAGSAVSMPWVGAVSSIIQAWYLGNEVGNAIGDVLWGKKSPSGRLPLTFPVRIEDIPAYPNLRAENGQIHYREDLFVGYKHYQSRRILPLFAFGFGLSYTKFSFSELAITQSSSNDRTFTATVSVLVKNEGSVPGSEVVQLYISYPDIGLTTPRLQLKGFAKAHDLSPGMSQKVTIELDKYAVSFWDTQQNMWKAGAGKYWLHVGSSSDDLHLEGTFELRQSFHWGGL